MSSAKSDGAPSEGPGAKPGSKSHTNDDLKTLPLAEVEKRLASSPKGLTQAEATTRLEQYGPNEIEAKKANQFLKFLGYFWGPIPWMIEVAVILSAVLGHWPDFIIILILLLAEVYVHVATDRAWCWTLDFNFLARSGRFRKESGKEEQKGIREDRQLCLCNFFL